MSKIEGLAGLASKLSKLGQAAGGRALRSAANKAMAPVVTKARSNAPIGTEAHRTHTGKIVAPGFLKRSIKKKTTLSKDKQSVSAMVGVSPEAFYGVAFIELGWKPGKRNKAARALIRRGIDLRSNSVPAQPWLEPAFQSSSAQVAKLLGINIAKNIEKVRNS